MVKRTAEGIFEKFQWICRRSFSINFRKIHKASCKGTLKEYAERITKGIPKRIDRDIKVISKRFFENNAREVYKGIAGRFLKGKAVASFESMFWEIGERISKAIFKEIAKSVLRELRRIFRRYSPDKFNESSI